MINQNLQTSGPRAERAPSRGGPPSSRFRKITPQYIFPLEYANFANFLLFEAVSQFDNLSKKDYSVNHLWTREGKSVSWQFWRELHTGNKAVMETGPMLYVDFLQ